MGKYEELESQLPSHSDGVTRATILIGTVVNALELSELEKLSALAECMKMFVDYTSLKCLVLKKDEDTISKIMEDLLSSIKEDE